MLRLGAQIDVTPSKRRLSNDYPHPYDCAVAGLLVATVALSDRLPILKIFWEGVAVSGCDQQTLPHDSVLRYLAPPGTMQHVVYVSYTVGEQLKKRLEISE